MATLTVARPYEPGPIQPLVLVGENIGVYSQTTYTFFKVVFVEAIPASRQMIQDLGAVADAASVGPTEMTIPRAQDGNLFHMRACPLDPIEVEVFEQRSTGRNTLFSTQARLTPQLGNVDPHFSASTLFVLGNEKNIYMTAYNERGYNLAQARMQFWGYRYVLNALPAVQNSALRKSINGSDLDENEKAIIQKGIRATIVPAEGRE